MFWLGKKITDIKQVVREDGSKGCEIELDKNLIKVIPTKMKPFQGWRYYLEDDIPQDLNVNNNEDEEFPEQIRSELIKLGLY